MKKKMPVLKPDRVSLGEFLSPYDKIILEDVISLGGFNNAHAHLDRADTIDDVYLTHINTTPLEASSLPLRAKQNLAGDLHRGKAYTKDDLRERMSRVLRRLILLGTTRLTTCIDASPNIAEGGMLAIDTALSLKKEFAGQIEMRIGPNPIFGFKEGSSRWEIFVEAASKADFLSCLPEKDDFPSAGTRDGKIGFRPHIRRVMELGCKLEKEVHLHLDQANDPGEAGTETLIEGLRWLDQPKIPKHKGPTVWVIHMISPSGYSEERFSRLIDNLLRFNLGVIVCPTAAVSMRQLRPIEAPLHSSIARVLELCKVGVPVLLGSDNICDVFVPQGDGDMLTEVKMAGHATRFSIPYVWAKLAAGVVLNEVDRATVGRFLYQDRKAFSSINPNYQPAVD